MEFFVCMWAQVIVQSVITCKSMLANTAAKRLFISVSTNVMFLSVYTSMFITINWYIVLAGWKLSCAVRCWRVDVTVSLCSWNFVFNIHFFLYIRHLQTAFCNRQNLVCINQLCIFYKLLTYFSLFFTAQIFSLKLGAAQWLQMTLNSSLVQM